MRLCALSSNQSYYISDHYYLFILLVGWHDQQMHQHFVLYMTDESSTEAVVSTITHENTFWHHARMSDFREWNLDMEYHEVVFWKSKIETDHCSN